MRTRLAVLLLAGSLAVGSASAAEIFVRIAPPPPVHVGVVGVAPGPNYAWVNGYHEWDGRAYRWHEGVWMARPYPRAVWVEHRWAPRRGGYVFVPGHWRR